MGFFGVIMITEEYLSTVLKGRNKRWPWVPENKGWDENQKYKIQSPALLKYNNNFPLNNGGNDRGTDPVELTDHRSVQ